MKLNPDCIRDILLFVEENVNNDFILVTDTNYKNYDRIAKYSFEEFEYHTNQIGMSGFLSRFKNDIPRAFMFHMLSPTGHEFLENIRTEENWHQTKTAAKNVGSFSLSVLNNIATNIISAAVTAYFSPK